MYVALLGEGALCLCPVNITAVGLLLRDCRVGCAWVTLRQVSITVLEWTQLCALGIAGGKLL